MMMASAIQTESKVKTHTPEGMLDIQIIEQIIVDYFDGLYEGDIDKLDRIFHDDVVLKAPNLRRGKSDWLKAVATRPVPQKEEVEYRFKLLAIEVIGDQAMVKLECPLFEKFYIDFIGLLKEHGRWLIVSKMYCDLAQ